MLVLRNVAWSVAVLWLLGMAPADKKAVTNAGEESKMSAQSVYDFTVEDIDGQDVALSKYKGDVLLIVNVASK